MNPDDQRAYDELSLYTLAHRDPIFIHQYIVDAFAAQTATAEDKPIKLTFALAGLYLHLERGYTGKEVQRAHMFMANRRKVWPRFALPAHRGKVTVHDVLGTSESERETMIEKWMASVWQAWAGSREQIISILADFPDIDSVRMR